jgi:GNAT superfamily N-acetyltransferase
MFINDTKSLANVARSALDLMCIDPDHQRQGAGTLLMQWGIEMADKLGTKVGFFCLCHRFRFTHVLF